MTELAASPNPITCRRCQAGIHPQLPCPYCSSAIHLSAPAPRCYRCGGTGLASFTGSPHRGACTVCQPAPVEAPVPALEGLGPVAGVCPWCSVPVPEATRRTRPLVLRGVVVGRLCPTCTSRSRELEDEAREGYGG